MRSPESNHNYQEQEISKDFITLENVEIAPNQPYTFDLKLFRKPVKIEDGDKIGGDTEIKFTGSVSALMEEAKQYSELPEKERLHKLLELIRSKLIYPYPEVVDELKMVNPDLEKWVNENFGKYPKWPTLNASLERGYGDCKIMAAAYLTAAQAAGLNGAYAKFWATGGKNPNTLKNLTRPDTNTPIFKLTEINQDAQFSHAWVDIQLSDGSWVPVDPAANMVGDTPEMLEFFTQANYRSEDSCKLQNLPKALQGYARGYFMPGEGVGNFQAVIQIETFGPLDQRKPIVPKFSGNIIFSLPVKTRSNSILAITK